MRAPAAPPTTLFCLHYLGGSGREYSAIAQFAGRDFHFVPVDLAGFGDANGATTFSVSDMAHAVADVVQRAAASRWWLLGHSMGAKVAAVLAGRIETGVLSVKGLESLVLLAGSPPAPEPMEDEKRDTMLGWFRGARTATLAEGRRYINQNISKPLSPVLDAQALADLQRMNPHAWAAWLNSGSREDWSDRVGLLSTPALLVAGADDKSLGPAAQRQLTAPHFANNELRVIDGVTHLLPLEAGAAIARLLDEHAAAFRG